MIFLKLLRESFLFAYDAIIQNKLRTLLSLLGVTIGIFTIILVFSAVDTFRGNLQKSVDKLGNNSIYIQKWPWLFSDDYPWWKYYQRPIPAIREQKLLQERSQTAAAISFEMFVDRRKVKYQSNTIDGVVLYAVSHEHAQTWNYEYADGRYFTDVESRTGAPVAVIGYDIADHLFPAGDAVGKRIKIMGRNVMVVGVFAKEGEDLLDISSDKQILLPLNFVRNIVDIKGERYQQQIVVKGKPGISEAEVESELRGLMRSIRRLRPGQEDNFSLNKTTLVTNQLDQLFTVINAAGFFIGIFSILVGGFGIANIMFVSVKERTNIIGIQKSLGAKNYFILIQFLIEAIVLCVLGGILGLFFVYLCTLAIKGIADVEIVLGLNNILIGVVSSALIGVISGIIPAWFAARLNPVDAIRSN
ncbi:FtsX-like permease family protein [Mucilaginibacter limnophilus]|uniref:FtsX-like permease family protein n=1 Tax=Mucilaginibacter limnophilus TaxID=1932778 RepID=A0A437MK67_9SPHI|nr:ABC transporter permease [Mucilaginibacter limnophilus]RVT98032.1 FtsX-like permease family protein [Mucilaginibacter limnophilus]